VTAAKAIPLSSESIRQTTRQPLLWGALAYGAGIIAGNYAWRPPLWWVIAILAFLLASAYFVRGRLWLAFSLALGALLCSGALAIQMGHLQTVGDDGILAFAGDEDVTITAHVIRGGQIREAGFGGLRQSLDVETEEIASGTERRFLHAGVRLGIYGKQTDPRYDSDETHVPMHTFVYGERLRFVAKLRPPRNFRNPGAFDYRGYLADRGIVVLASTKIIQVESLPGFVGSRLEQRRERMQRSIVQKIQQLWVPEDAALMSAAVVGESAFLTPGTKADFQRSGTYHILVVSGLNVSILACVVFWVMRRLRAGDILASTATVVVCAAYAFVTDVGPPAWRAVLMLAIYLGVRLVYRERSMLNALGAAALGVMAADPKALLGPSFQLTFLAVLIIAAIAIPLLERTSQPYSRGLRHLDAPDFDRTLPPRVAQNAFGSPYDCRSPRLVAGQKISPICHERGHAKHPLRLRNSVRLRLNASWAGAAHGLLLSPGHGDGNIGEFPCCAVDRHPDACCGAERCA
jgi:competence protein ComEC